MDLIDALLNCIYMNQAEEARIHARGEAEAIFTKMEAEARGILFNDVIFSVVTFIVV